MPATQNQVKAAESPWELQQRALEGDRHAAQAVIRQGRVLIPALLQQLLQPSTDQQNPAQRRRLIILLGRIAARWPAELLEALARIAWQRVPAPILAELMQCLRHITGRHQEQVIDMALEIISEAEQVDEDTRLVAAQLLVELPRPRSAEVLWWALLNDPASTVKEQILDGMESRPLLRAPEAIPALSQLRLDPYLAEYHPRLMGRVEHLLHRLRSERVISGVLETQTSEVLL